MDWCPAAGLQPLICDDVCYLRCIFGLETLYSSVQKCAFLEHAWPYFPLSASRAAVFVVTGSAMGKPLSRPDCLRQNPPCVGKGEEEEDLNIEDCYVPQRSIYDTVRLNEQIDSGSKGSLSSRHFTDRTLPYSHRTLDVSSLCSNGPLASSSAFELRGREAHRLDEKMIFDALKLNSDVIRSTGLPKAKSHAEKKEHRRSWRMFVPANFVDYANKSESSFVEPADLSDAVAKAGKCRGATSSLPSEEDDSGLCGPPAEREEKQRLFPGDPSQIRSLSSVEDAHTAEQYRPFFSVNSISEQKMPLLSCRSTHLDDNFKMILHDASPPEETKPVHGQREIRGENSCLQDDVRESALKGGSFILPREGESKCISNPREEGRTYGSGEFQTTAQRREFVGDSPEELAVSCTDLGGNVIDWGGTGLVENLTLLTQYDSEESNVASQEDVEAPLSVQEMEAVCEPCSSQFRAVRKQAAPRKTGAHAGTLDPVCNGFHSAQVINRDGKFAIKWSLVSLTMVSPVLSLAGVQWAGGKGWLTGTQPDGRH